MTSPSLTHTLSPGTFLVCHIEPDTLVPGVNYTTRWITPRGLTINSSQDRFVFYESAVTSDGLPGTVFVISQVSYQDAGTYTCEGRYNASGDSAPWASATIDLQLLRKS